MKKVQKYVFTLVLMMNYLYSGTPEQKSEANNLRKSYPNLFQYYNLTTYTFNDKSMSDQIFFNDEAVSEINQVFSSLMYLNDLPLVISPDNKDFIDSIDQRVKYHYPDTTYKYLEDEMFRNANPWKNLGVAGSADVLITAALTGPKVGLDIVSGGAGKIAKGLGYFGKAGDKVVLIGSKFNMLKPVQYSKLFGFINGKYAKIINLKTMQAMYKMDTNTFKVYKFLIDSVFASADAAREVSLNQEQKNIISQYVNNYQDDTNNVVAQYLFTLKTNQYKLTAELLGNSVVALMFDVFQKGVLTIAALDPDSLTLLKDIIIEFGLVGSEFVPVAGPIVETFNKNRAAMQKIESNFLKAQSNYLTFSAQREKEYTLELNLYKLTAIEDTLKEIYSNTLQTNNTGNIERTYSVTPSINNIASAIYDWDLTIPKEIFYSYTKCLGSYIQLSEYERSATSTISNPIGLHNNRINGIDICDIKNNYYKAKLNLNHRVKESKAELYITLNNRVLYNIPNEDNFEDVKAGTFYYPYVKYLSYKSVVDGRKLKYQPNNYLTQFEALVMITNLFFKEEFNSYITDKLDPDNQQHRFDFITQKLQSEITGVNYATQNKFITRGEVAELLMKTLYIVIKDSKFPYTRYSDGSHVRYLDKYVGTIDSNNGWNVFSTGLKACEISKGYSNGKYGLSNNVSRGEIAVLLVRAYNLIKKYQ